MSLRLPAGPEMQISVMPAWIAGIRVNRMRPETSMSIWIPALHAGMMQSRDSAQTDIDRPYFQKSTRSWENSISKFEFQNYSYLCALCG
jgi:hypothetical protein